MVLTGYLMSHQYRTVAWTKIRYLEIAIIGAVVTLFFDLITNLGYALWFGIPYFVAVIAGLLFIGIHVISNAIIFSAIVPTLDMTMKKQLESLFNEKRSPS